MAVSKEIKTTFLLAYPVMLSQLGQVAVGVADSMMVGRLGALELAASSLANSIFFVALMFGIGISMGLTPLVSMPLERERPIKSLGYLAIACLSIFSWGSLVWACAFVFSKSITVEPAGRSRSFGLAFFIDHHGLTGSVDGVSSVQAVCRRPFTDQASHVHHHCCQLGQRFLELAIDLGILGIS